MWVPTVGEILKYFVVSSLCPVFGHKNEDEVTQEGSLVTVTTKCGRCFNQSKKLLLVEGDE